MVEITIRIRDSECADAQIAKEAIAQLLEPLGQVEAIECSIRYPEQLKMEFS